MSGSGDGFTGLMLFRGGIYFKVLMVFYHELNK